MDNDNNAYQKQINNDYPTHKQTFAVLAITIVLTSVIGAIAILLNFSRTQIFLIEIMTIVPAYFFVVKNNFSRKKVFRLNPVSKDVIISAILIGLALTVLSDEVDRIIQIFFPMPDIILEAIETSLKINSISDFLIITISAVFLAAFCEELLFRGFLQTSLENTFDITKAIMLTALIFAIVHFNPWWTIQLILFGIFLGVVAWKTNSIIPSIIIHFMNNAIALIFNNLNESQLEWYLTKNHVSPFVIIFALIAGVFGFKKLYTIYEENDNE